MTAAANKELHSDDKQASVNTIEQLTTPNRPTKKIPLMNSLNKSATVTPTSAKTPKDNATPSAITNKITEPDISAPQSIAIVAGRKYIMVPKTAKVNTTPDPVNGNQSTKSS